MVPSPRKLAYRIVSCSGEVSIKHHVFRFRLHIRHVKSQSLSVLRNTLDVSGHGAMDELSATISQDVLTPVAGPGTSSISTSLG